MSVSFINPLYTSLSYDNIHTVIGSRVINLYILNQLKLAFNSLATGNTPVCGRRYEHSKNITLYIAPRKYASGLREKCWLAAGCKNVDYEQIFIISYPNPSFLKS